MGQGHITAQEPMERVRIRWGAIPQEDAFAILWGRGTPSRTEVRSRGLVLHSVIKRVQEHHNLRKDMGPGGQVIQRPVGGVGDPPVTRSRG